MAKASLMHPGEAGGPFAVARRWAARLRAWSARLGEAGNVTVEAAMVLPPFLLLFLAILELGYMVYVQTVLDGAARDAARLIRTGQVQASADPLSAFRDQLCAEMSPIVGCSSLVFNVQSFTSFGGVNFDTQRDPTGKMVGTSFTPGVGGSYVAVQVTYNRPFITAYVGQYLGGPSQSAFLSSTVVFRNEPFKS
jgi:Flp pilus assembly protein TadG